MTGMESATARIAARTQRQAMDWSLVLVSQGIESIIDHSGEGAGWGLIVAAGDFEPALGAIRQYRLENRRWSLRQPLFRTGFLFDWSAVAWALLAGVFFSLDARVGLRSPGIMDTLAYQQGEWWRLFTAMWLHADLGHLGTNLAIGLVLLGLTMGRFGTGVGLLAAYLAGAAGNVASMLASSSAHRSLGASGLVMGALGLLTVQSLSFLREKPPPLKLILSSLFAGVMLFILLGLTPGTDVMAHFGGFLGGVLLGSLVVASPDIAEKHKLNAVCGLAFAALVIWPWWLALARAKGAAP
jgi:membrane associated rhomboid family serine protease